MTENSNKLIYTVSKLTKDIKSLLEEAFPFLWITGEISNYSVPASGHAYFTLKDNSAVISCVMFKNQNQRLKFELENGIKIFGMARLSLYAPRGSYQLIFEHIEPEGAGSAQLAFEQLKKKLAAKGFFDDINKKPIPFLPSKTCVVTSGTGAAVQDILNIAQRRFSNCHIEIFSVKVQGENSEYEISKAIELINEYQKSDLIIIARGGGSLEDLASFNSEMVANAIFNSKIPVITGIGHETDFTIADFVADLRAPTPSAAAELAFQDKKILKNTIFNFTDNLNSSFNNRITALNKKILDLNARIKTPQTIIYDYRLRLLDYESRLSNYFQRYLKYKREKLLLLSDSLNSLNPEIILKRGYSITRSITDKKVIFNADDLQKNDKLEIILSKGKLITKVEKING
ncbi:MAG: exodeoxyribonuclease VII large subunit [archaeon]|nr:exodeoxyribonuclease VII large subunit [archaeon]